MSVSESERRDIYNGLETAIGLDAANSLMQLLPYQPASQHVTRADMHAQTTRLQGQMSELGSELRTEMSELRTELRTEMSELRTEMAELRTELKTEMSELRSDVRGDHADLKIGMQRWMTGVAAANTIAVVTALLT